VSRGTVPGVNSGRLAQCSVISIEAIGLNLFTGYPSGATGLCRMSDEKF